MQTDVPKWHKKFKKINKNRRFAQLTAAIVGPRRRGAETINFSVEKKNAWACGLPLTKVFPQWNALGLLIKSPHHTYLGTSKVDSPPLKGLAGAAFGTTSTSRSLRSSPAPTFSTHPTKSSSDLQPLLVIATFHQCALIIKASDIDCTDCSRQSRARDRSSTIN